MTLAPSSASSSSQVPAALSVANSSSRLYGLLPEWPLQSGLHLALASMQGSKASASAVSAAKTCLGPSKSSSSSVSPSATNHAPPASSGRLRLFGKQARQLHANSFSRLQVGYELRWLPGTCGTSQPW